MSHSNGSNIFHVPTRLFVAAGSIIIFPTADADCQHSNRWPFRIRKSAREFRVPAQPSSSRKRTPHTRAACLIKTRARRNTKPDDLRGPLASSWTSASARRDKVNITLIKRLRKEFGCHHERMLANPSL